jgi:excisionase family DNA binding protein
MKNVQLHTIDETAQLLSVSRSSVYRLIKANELLVVHIGCSARIPNKCLVDYVERLIRQERLVAQ